MEALQDLGRQRPRLKAGVNPTSIDVPVSCDQFADISSVSESAAHVSPSMGTCALESSTSSSDAETALARTVWLNAIKDAVLKAQIVHLNVQRTFVVSPQRRDAAGSSS